MHAPVHARSLNLSISASFAGTLKCRTGDAYTAIHSQILGTSYVYVESIRHADTCHPLRIRVVSIDNPGRSRSKDRLIAMICIEGPLHTYCKGTFLLGG